MALAKPSTGKGRGSKAKYTDKQKNKAAAIEARYIERGVKPAEAAERAWRTVNKQDHGGRKSGGGRSAAPAPAPLRKGSRVSWKWGTGTAAGKLLQLFRRKVTKKIEGVNITRNADPTTPAALVQTGDGKKALKSVSELQRITRKSAAKKTARK